MNSEFDSHAENYAQQVRDSLGVVGASHDFFLQVKAERLLGLLNDKKKAQVLDVGCGIGLMQPWFVGKVGAMHGADVSEASLAVARQRNPESHFAVIKDGVLPYPDGYFDLVFAVCVLHHVPPQAWQGFVDEMARVTRKGGIIAIAEHNPWNPMTQIIVRRSALDENAILLNAKQSRDLIQKTGIAAVQTEHFLFTPFQNKMMRKVDNALARVPLGAQYMAWGRKS